MMQQYPFQPSPLNYATPVYANRPRRNFLMWFVILGFLILVFLFLQNSHPKYQEIPLSQFRGDLIGGRISDVVVEEDNITGLYSDSAPTPYGHFRTLVPTGTSSNWAFVQWLLENAGPARVTVQNNSNLVLNILLPLLPWLLIFGFIWFFVFRKLKRASSQVFTQPFYPPPPSEPR